MEIRNIKRIVFSFSLLWGNALLAGTVMPEAPVRQHDIQRPGEFKPVFGGQGGPGFFVVDRDGTIREGDPRTAGRDACWGSTEVQGLNGPLICCPDDVMRELRRKQKLQCLQPGQDPRELSQQEMAGLQFKDGRPVADAAEDCKPFVCDQNCDQQNQPAHGQRTPGQPLRERDRWAMDDGDDNDNTKPGTPQTDSADADAKKQIEKLKEAKEEERLKENAKTAKDERDRARADREKLEGEYGRRGKSGQNTPSGLELKEKIEKAKEREATAQKRHEVAREALYNFKKDDVDRPRDDDNDPRARERFCRMNPDQCPERQRYKKFGSGKGRGVDTWVVNPKPEDAGGGVPGEDPYGEVSQFLCIMDGQRQGQGLGNDRGMNAGMNAGGNCQGEGDRGQAGRAGGFGRNEGQAQEGQEGIDVARRDNCDNEPRGPRLPGDDVINPGDPTFFQCPEMGCPNQRQASITMNNCPDNSVIGRRSKMSCNPYNGPAGAIDPVRE